MAAGDLKVIRYNGTGSHKGDEQRELWARWKGYTQPSNWKASASLKGYSGKLRRGQWTNCSNWATNASRPLKPSQVPISLAVLARFPKKKRGSSWPLILQSPIIVYHGIFFKISISGFSCFSGTLLSPSLILAGLLSWSYENAWWASDSDFLRCQVLCIGADYCTHIKPCISNNLHRCLPLRDLTCTGAHFPCQEYETQCSLPLSSKLRPSVTATFMHVRRWSNMQLLPFPWSLRWILFSHGRMLPAYSACAFSLFLALPTRSVEKHLVFVYCPGF